MITDVKRLELDQWHLIRTVAGKPLSNPAEYEIMLEAGYRMGFENLSHFSRVFEKHIGKKPKKYSSEL